MNTSKQINAMIGLMFLTFAILGAYFLYEGRREDKATEELTERNAERGARLFVANCRTCHGMEGEGAVGPALNTQAFAVVDEFNQEHISEAFALGGLPEITPVGDSRNVERFLESTINCGRAGTAMPTWGQANGGPLSTRQVDNIVLMVTNARWDLVEDEGLHADEEGAVLQAAMADVRAEGKTPTEIVADVAALQDESEAEAIAQILEPAADEGDRADLAEELQGRLDGGETVEDILTSEAIDDTALHGALTTAMGEALEDAGDLDDALDELAIDHAAFDAARRARVVVTDASTLAITQENCGQYNAVQALPFRQRALVLETTGGPDVTATPSGTATGEPSGPMVQGVPVADFFAASCAVCHGQNREGLVGPPLTPETLTQPDEFYFDTIKNGRAGTVMPAWGQQGLTDEDINALLQFEKYTEP
jgi:mono/diheme cytochrome c family protein